MTKAVKWRGKGGPIEVSSGEVQRVVITSNEVKKGKNWVIHFRKHQKLG